MTSASALTVHELDAHDFLHTSRARDYKLEFFLSLFSSTIAQRQKMEPGEQEVKGEIECFPI